MAEGRGLGSNLLLWAARCPSQSRELVRSGGGEGTGVETSPLVCARPDTAMPRHYRFGQFASLDDCGTCGTALSAIERATTT